ncbi:MAG: hypothetical protein IJK93_11160 [Muribaculaceae bacterium]|nr:hypothetical protein [Muribaculaceae bacterium]
MMKRFFLSLLLCISAGMTVSAASVSAVQDGNEDDGATTPNIDLITDIGSLDSTFSSKKLIRIDDIVVVVGGKIDPTGIGGSVGDGPRVPTDVSPGNRNKNNAPEVTPTSDGTTGGIVNNNAVTSYGSFDATGTSMDAQGGTVAAKIPAVLVEPGLPVLPDGVGGHVSGDGSGPKPTLPTKPTRPSGSRKYSNGSVTVVVSGGDQGGNPRASGNVAKVHAEDLKPFLPYLPDGVGGSVVSDNPKPIKPGTSKFSKDTGDILPGVRPGGNNGGSGWGSQGSDVIFPTTPEGEYAPSVNGVNITNLIPTGSKKDLASTAALIDMILEADPDLDFSEAAALVDELLAH